MLNKIFILILTFFLASCATQKGNYIALPEVRSSKNPIKIHYNGKNPPSVIFIKDKLPDASSITQDYTPYGDSYWWWH